MNPAAPRVSVVLPVFNGARHLRESVASVLAQTFADLELIIVDDGSTDATPEILDALADARIVRIRHAENLGLVAALNAGLAAARGEFIARQDADDVSLPERFAEQIAAFAAPDLVILGTAYERIDEAGRELGNAAPPAEDAEIRWMSLFHTSFAHTSVMLRASALRAAPSLAYDPALASVQDFKLWRQLLARGRGANLARPLVRYRVHAGQASAVHADRRLANADRISREALGELGFAPSPQELRALRDWMLEFPPRLAPSDAPTLALLAQILEAFLLQPGLEPGAAARLRRRMLLRFMNAAPVRIWRTAGVSALLRRDPGALAQYAARGARYHGRRLLAGGKAAGGAP